ncbi:hypothetical protein A3A35_02215 [Candidatus Kaiserbacteria bacterium RIFCSPLOWO2_01_FULL_51_21]|uniref:TrpR like protein, YerC/YecD n=1 Tax=Candidatus Kaiserbacteria bacterium RIFCSPLOWO2_01_FULL_51_21 TaxID=1798508 RepID=A0A1F6ED49_9BACT|nr:MAG: hypothetical protein A3A35_02215 [Candidatus Kaiserbacteria bacterium RIFCSPLOWO2_01_FULL_51_21]
MKVRAKTLTKEQRIETLDALYTAASSIQGREAVKLFLRDLLTESERIMMGRRIIIARKLIAGASRDTIASELRVGYDTIHRVHRWLHDQFPGYEQAIREMEKEFKKRQNAREDKRMYATSALYRLKKKYPLHFLLFPLPKSSQISRKSS